MTEKTNQEILNALLGANNDDVQAEVEMKRFGFNFVVKALTPDQMSRITERATKRGAKNQKVLDEDLFNYLTIVEACQVPNWNDPDLKKGLNAIDAVDAVKKRLLFGEVAILLNAIGDLNDFNKSDEEMIDEVKN